MASPIVSIMMPAYNAEKYIGRAIESVLAQSYPHWELLIVNDGSTDQTPQVISRYRDERIKVFHQPNGGESAARNTALKDASGEYLAFLDADDLYMPEHLERTITFLQAHPEYDGVYGDGYYMNEMGERLKPLSSHRRGPFEGDIFEELVRASDVFGAPVCVVLRSEIIARHGLEFDTDIVIGPDWDFFIRYAEIGKFGFVSRPTCLYRLHTCSISVQTSAPRRRLHLAKCREKAIKLRRFRECSVATRTFVFYDLLVNLLTGLPKRQSDITQSPEFLDLPTNERGWLFRRMASEALLQGEEHPRIAEWLRQSCRLNPADFNAAVLNFTYKINPLLCTSLVKSWSRRKNDQDVPLL